MSLISAGDVGDGQKAWGDRGKKSCVPVQSIQRIALLTSSAKLAAFTGRRANAPEPKSRMAEFIEHYQARASPDAPPLIVEIHACVPIKRKKPECSTARTVERPTQRRLSYNN